MMKACLQLLLVLQARFQEAGVFGILSLAGVSWNEHGFTKFNVHPAEGVWEKELVPGVKLACFCIVHMDGDNRQAGQLGELDDTWIELVARATRPVWCDAQVTSLSGMFGQFNESLCAASGTGAAGGKDLEFGTGLGDDFAIAAWACQDDG